jgi:5-methylcytosine-specific restriction endonuclease McrA
MLSLRIHETPEQRDARLRAEGEALQAHRCYECGGPIGNLRWSRCSYCYWKDQVETLEAMRAGDRAARRQAERDAEPLWEPVDAARTHHVRLTAQLHHLGPVRAAIAFRLKREIREVWQTYLSLSRRHNEVAKLAYRPDRTGATLRKARKRLSSLKPYDGSAEALAHAEQERKKRIALAELYTVFDRTRVLIREADYRRGNSLDNYVRTALRGRILEAFSGQCAGCGAADDLTLDHFAIAKNSGGNFILYVVDTGSLQLNVVPLCRPCNASKGERLPVEIFTAEQIQRIQSAHAVLLSDVLASPSTISTLVKWYKLGRAPGSPLSHNLPLPFA